VRYFVFFPFILFLFSCNESSNNNDDDVLNRKQMLSDYADYYIIPKFEQLYNDLDLLESNLIEINSTEDISKIDEFKNQFLVSYKSWQYVAFLNFGPAESNSLNNICNIYPVNINKINSNIESGNYNLLSAINTDAIGFPALDYLLFADDLNEEFNFDNANFKKYISDNIALMKSRVDVCLKDWKGNYKISFKDNDGKSVGSGLSMIVNSINRYWEKDLRDGKLGIPIGVRSNGVVLKEKSEAYYSDYSLELLKASIKGFSEFYINSDQGLSLFDYLYNRRNEYGDGKLHQTIKSNFENILIRVESLQGSLSQNIDQNNQELLSIYQEFQKQIVYLKVDMPSILGVSITYQDNDGD